MRYRGKRHNLSIPKRSNEHATDRRTSHSVKSQTVCNPNCSLRTVFRFAGEKYAAGFPHPWAPAAMAMEREAKERGCYVLSVGSKGVAENPNMPLNGNMAAM